MEEEFIHLYFREAKTGRFITHFLFPMKEFKYFEEAAELEGISTEDLIVRAITEYCEREIKRIKG